MLLTQSADKITPLLHHLRSLRKIVSVVIRSPDLVLINMRKLRLDQLATMPHLMQHG